MGFIFLLKGVDMDNFNFNLFKYFYYVAYYKGFTNAAKNLNIVQSALSYNIKTLESVMDKVLIIRNSKTFELTEDGYELYETLKSVFGILEENFQLFNKNKYYDEISIGIRHYLSDFILEDIIREFIENNPNIHININLYSKLDAKKYEDDYDILIDYSDYTNLLDDSNKKTKLCELSNSIVCGKELFNSYKDCEKLEELQGAKFISLCPSKKKGKFQKYCFDKNMLFTDVVSINDSSLCKKLIKDNIGLCLVNDLFVKNELINGDIRKINLSDNLFSDEIIIVCKNNKKKNITDKFITILKNKYNGKETI